MGEAAGVRNPGGVKVTTDHFDTTEGTLSPQPWMQLRQVADVFSNSVARTYSATGGQNKNEVLQDVVVTWTNNTPMVQYVYGLVHHGGSVVSLQTRSRGYLRVSHSMSAALNPKASAPSPLVEVSRFGGGADLGVGGILGIGTDFGVHEVRSHSTSVPLMPHLTGWMAVSPGNTVTAQVEVRFVSEKWESTSVTNGRENTDCTVLAGELRVDLFAVPVIEAPPQRTTPTVVGWNTAMKTSVPVVVSAPAGTRTGDVLLAICGSNLGDPGAMTAPAGWKLLHAVNTNQFDFLNSHVKVYAKLAGDNEPASYSFGNAFLVEQIVHVVALRDAVMPTDAVDSDGWSIASARKRWKKTGDMHIAPSMATDGQVLICASFFGLTDNILDGFGVVQVQQTPPVGMTSQAHLYGASSSMAVAALNNPPNPTQERTFTTTPRAYFLGDAVTLAILVAGRQEFV